MVNLAAVLRGKECDGIGNVLYYTKSTEWDTFNNPLCDLKVIMKLTKCGHQHIASAYEADSAVPRKF
ncbi:MAG: hypothetical protein CMN21_08635 [Rubinisphaera sp.]|nr:hypothetical protein [Rubinisphaera sp.]